ncbi:MAG TPA: helix-turn-helix domain-containing protein [Ktedonobacterales bacterium]|nr:helix-turn-helix domain-containing protein [Ktedonobacterales bacterium]
MDNEPDIMREGELLGMNLSTPRAVILIDASDYILASDGDSETGRFDAQIPGRAQCVIASIVGFFALPSDTICAYIGDGEIAVLKAAGTHDLVAWTDNIEVSDHPAASWANLAALKRAAAALLTRLRHDTGTPVTIGIGRYHPGVYGLANSYRDARMATTLGRRFQGQNRVHCLDGLGVAAFIGVSDERTKVDLATHLLSPLDKEPELIESLRAFFKANCCPSSTAGALCIHRNTLSYRLEKIAMLTGLDPRHFDDAVQIRLALLVRALHAKPD